MFVFVDAIFQMRMLGAACTINVVAISEVLRNIVAQVLGCGGGCSGAAHGCRSQRSPQFMCPLRVPITRWHCVRGWQRRRSCSRWSGARRASQPGKGVLRPFVDAGELHELGEWAQFGDGVACCGGVC